MTKTDAQSRNTVISPVMKTFRFNLHNSYAQDPKAKTDAKEDRTTGDGHGNESRPDGIVVIQYDFYHQIPALKQIRDKFFPNKYADIQMELSVHSCSASMYNELKFVFPALQSRQDLWIIPLFQHTQLDILGTGPHVEQEKSKCLENVYLLGYTLCLAAKQAGYWADFTDPASGFPMLDERGTSYYPDVVGCQRLLGYDTTNCGCCSVLSHPKFGTRIYPATLFFQCPQSFLRQLLSIVD